MPMFPPRRCGRCGQLCKGKCPRCDSWSGRDQTKNWSRTKTKANDVRWRRVRSQRLAEDPWCELCSAIADTVDHLDGADYEDDSGLGASWLNIDMTRSLCTPCHRKRTAEQGRRAQGMSG